MDYVVGSVAALISGNVTPNRPRLLRRALTPTKHQPSPNVTPKSEAVDDRSIFLSPTLQKKKAIVKKSPKRIFQNPDLDTTENDNDSSLVSPKAEKVKKHLKVELEADSMPKKSQVTVKSPKNKRERTSESEVPDIKTKEVDLILQVENESTPKKKKRDSEPTDGISDLNEPDNNETSETNSGTLNNSTKSPKKMKQRRRSIFEDTPCMETGNTDNAEHIEPTETEIKPKSTTKNKKNKQSYMTVETAKTDDNENKEQPTPNKKKNKKRKKKSKAQNTPEVTQDHETDKENQKSGINEQKKKNHKKKKSKAHNTIPMETDEIPENTELNKNKKSKKSVVNPNAVTNKDSDSEHDSDDEIESENETINKTVLEIEPPESSSDEEEEKPKESEKKVEKDQVNDVEVLKRTLFVGNVPFSKKCKKEIKKIFNKHGQIETIRIRTVPVKDARTTPKLAVIKTELHPERSTVNVYIKYTDPDSVEKALSENNTVLNEHHLRVSRSDNTGAEHDPKSSVFVGNLPFALEDEALRAKFEKCGEIDSVRIIRDKKTNAGKGFGYVNFKSRDGVELALALPEEDLTIKNRILRVKRCTQTAQKGKHQPNQRREFKKFGRDQGDRLGGQGQNRQPNQRREFKKFGRDQGDRSGGHGQNYQPTQRREFKKFGRDQGDRSGGHGQNYQPTQRREFKKFGRDQGERPGGQGQMEDGAFRRIANKRTNQDGGSEGPANKRQKNLIQPGKEKKARKEFVGMTAEKKKKHKFNKGLKKKKALSEILTK